MAISLLFSIIIYSIASTEVRARIDYLQHDTRSGFTLNQSRFENLRNIQVHKAEANLIGSLIVTNLCIWIVGGIGSYYLARQSLTPIEKALEAQSRFVSDASHELRTPLASIKTEIEVALRDPALSPTELRELLTSNLEEVNKLTKLSQNLLHLSQLDVESILREKVNLDEIAMSVIARFDKTSKRVKLVSNKSNKVLANKSSIEELMTILLDNALKYSPKDSQVTITLIRKKHMAGFEIVNKGNGIPPDILPHIFDRFYRADTSRTNREKKGYGLGLSLAKRIVELNEGELTVSSAPHLDTTFRVLLLRFSQSKKVVSE